jgi:hypothetical protein
MVLKFKQKLQLVRRRLSLAPFAARYHAAVQFRASLDRQVQLLPAPRETLIAWVRLEGVRHRVPPPLWQACSDPWWRFARAFEVTELRRRTSVFDVACGNKTQVTIRQMFVEGRHYRATPQYAAMAEHVRAKPREGTWACRSLADVDRYFQRLHSAFESMRRDGYLSQQQLGGYLRDELSIYIAADGSSARLPLGGNHRIFMAELLGIEWIPVLIQCVHPQWLLGVSEASSLPPHSACDNWLSAHDDFSLTPPLQGRRPPGP